MFSSAFITYAYSHDFCPSSGTPLDVADHLFLLDYSAGLFRQTIYSPLSSIPGYLYKRPSFPAVVIYGISPLLQFFLSDFSASPSRPFAPKFSSAVYIPALLPTVFDSCCFLSPRTSVLPQKMETSFATSLLPFNMGAKKAMLHVQYNSCCNNGASGMPPLSLRWTRREDCIGDIYTNKVPNQSPGTKPTISVESIGLALFITLSYTIISYLDRIWEALFFTSSLYFRYYYQFIQRVKIKSRKLLKWQTAVMAVG